jgi:hypothetical protein
VIFINDFNRRKERRGTRDTPPMNTGRSKKSLEQAQKHYVLNDNEINKSRLKKRIDGLPPLLETNILRVCRQTHVEGSGIMWRMNTFAVAVPMINKDERHGELVSLFAGMDAARIQHLRIEIQLDSGPDVSARALVLPSIESLTDRKAQPRR